MLISTAAFPIANTAIKATQDGQINEIDFRNRLIRNNKRGTGPLSYSKHVVGGTMVGDGNRAFIA